VLVCLTAATAAVAPAYAEQPAAGAAVAPAHAEQPAAAAPVAAIIAAFNRGDAAAAKAMLVAEPMIVDADVSPFAWIGATAFDDWLGALTKREAATGKTGGKVALGPVKVTMVEGDHAYLVYPVSYSFAQKGQPMRETGTFTPVTVKQGTAWAIRSWTWTSPAATPVRK